MKIIPDIHEKSVRVAWAFLLAATLAGCVKEKFEMEPRLTDGEATFTVSVPGMQTPSTRALDATKEKELTAIDVVIFSNTTNTLLEHHRIGASDIGGGTGGNDYQFRIKGIENTANVTLAVIANASDEVAAAVGSGTPKTDFLSALKASAPVEWDTSPVGYRTIPMYGEITVTGNIYDAVTNTVNLTRMLAKVDVVNGVAPSGTPSDGDFELTAVHVVNRNTAGLIAPKWNATTGAPEPPPATTPNLPVGFDPQTAVWANDNQLTYTLSTGHASLENEIYLFESSALSANPQTPNGLRLVFEGNYTSGGVTKRYYYPVDFTAPGGAYMPVLRNHRYLFTITEAAGRGYDGLGEAVAAFGVMSNFRTSLVVVDESGIRHMVWNGEHFLGVSEKSFTVAAAGQQNVELQISTNYTGGWTASVENAAVNSWLTLGAASGGVVDKTLTFSAVVLSDEWGARTGAILLTAGRLDMRIPVTQGEFKIATESATLLMDGTPQSFLVKANFTWKAEFVGATANVAGFDNQIVTLFNEQTGGPNTTTGDPVTFTCNNYINNWDPDYPTEATVTVKFSRLDPVVGWMEWDTYDIICSGVIRVGESNCYMINNENPIPILIPISQIQYTMNGNAGAGTGFLGSGWISDFSKLKAQVLWSDVNKLNGEDDAVVKDVTYNGGLTIGDGKIVVVPGTGVGNAGIILYEDKNSNNKYDSGDLIRWSWHIWNVDYYPYNNDGTANTKVTPNTNGFMDRNLGATSSTVGEIETAGLTYQWGRKDPFPGASAWSNVSQTFYYPAGNFVSFVDNGTPIAVNLTNSVQNPLTRYVIEGYGDWFTNISNTSYQNQNLWGGANILDGFLHSGSKKSVYDPCPEGYCVPKNGAEGWGAGTSDGTWNSTTNGWNHTNYGGYYPLAGRRLHNVSGMSNVTSYGTYWQATPSSFQAYTLGLPNGSGTVNPSASYNRANGFPVRCRAE